MRARKPDDADEENYTVQIWRDRRTGVPIMEDWRDADGRLHRTDGPSFIERDHASKVLTHESWHQHGQTHREDGPAIIKRDSKTGRITFSSWYENGRHIPKNERSERHRSDAPKPTP